MKKGPLYHLAGDNTVNKQTFPYELFFNKTDENRLALTTDGLQNFSYSVKKAMII